MLGEPMVLVFSPSDSYALFCSITIESILLSSTENEFFDVYIIYDELTDESMNLLSDLSCERLKINFINIYDRIKNETMMKNRGYVSRNTYFRILAPSLFENHKKFYILIQI